MANRSTIPRRWDDPLSRRDFILAGLVLFAIKHALDRAVSHFVFGRSWSLSSYPVPNQTSLLVQHLRDVPSGIAFGTGLRALPAEARVAAAGSEERLRRARVAHHCVRGRVLPDKDMTMLSLHLAFSARRWSVRS